MNLDLVIDATPTRDHLRDLAAQGFPAAWIADRIGMARNGVIAIRSGRRRSVHPYTARTIARLHAELRGANPADYGVSKYGITVAQWLPLTPGMGRMTTTRPVCDVPGEHQGRLRPYPCGTRCTRHTPAALAGRPEATRKDTTT